MPDFLDWHLSYPCSELLKMEMFVSKDVKVLTGSTVSTKLNQLVRMFSSSFIFQGLMVASIVDESFSYIEQASFRFGRPSYPNVPLIGSLGKKRNWNVPKTRTKRDNQPKCRPMEQKISTKRNWLRSSTFRAVDDSLFSRACCWHKTLWNSFPPFSSRESNWSVDTAPGDMEILVLGAMQIPNQSRYIRRYHSLSCPWDDATWFGNPSSLVETALSTSSESPRVLL
jgi:hypothetical protein